VNRAILKHGAAPGETYAYFGDLAILWSRAKYPRLDCDSSEKHLDPWVSLIGSILDSIAGCIIWTVTVRQKPAPTLHITASATRVRKSDEERSRIAGRLCRKILLLLRLAVWAWHGHEPHREAASFSDSYCSHLQTARNQATHAASWTSFLCRREQARPSTEEVHHICRP